MTLVPGNVPCECSHQFPDVDDDLHDLVVDEVLRSYDSPFSAEITPVHQAFMLGEVVHDDTT